MSGPVNAITPALFNSPPPASFIAANGTVAKILVDQMAPQLATTLAPALYGGGTVIDLVGVNSDSVSHDVLLYQGFVATTQSAGVTGTMTTTTSSIPRTSGSFIADGWQVGDVAMCFAPFGTAPNAGVDGIPCTVTAVSALGLTLNGTPIAALALAAGTRVCRVAQRVRQTIAAGAGTNGTTASQALIASYGDGTMVRTELKIGANNILAAAMQAAVSALPAQVSLSAVIAQY